MIFRFEIYVFILYLTFNSVLSSFVYNGKANAVQIPPAFKSTFKACCSLGSQNANISSTCDDYSVLTDKSSGCKAAYSICCTQNKRQVECERGKKHALAGSPCADLKNNNVCDAVTVSF